MADYCDECGFYYGNYGCLCDYHTLPVFDVMLENEEGEYVESFYVTAENRMRAKEIAQEAKEDYFKDHLEITEII